MADDIQSNIRINIDTASAMDSIRLLQNQISAFHTQMAKMGAASAADSRNLQQNLINSINSTNAFSASMTKVKTTAEHFTSALEKNKLTMGEYFRYAGGASKTFGKLFASEFETINKVARERVKDLQTQYIKMGRDANGAMQAIKVRPLTLDMQNLATKTQIAAQRQQLLNQLLKQGSTNLLNFGKNTQWAGRQLMVGFTIPLSIMGGAAMKAYREIEEASIRLKRVYGDFGTTAQETEKMVKQVQSLALEYTKYGVAVKDSMDMAATAAATGKKGAELLAQVASANKLSALGGVDQQKALQTTISLTDAFNISAKDLGKNINFLNAVENQTVLSIEDLTTAIPKAAPVIQQLGGDVKDLAFFLTAMKEGGINASEGANAIKSGLASLINPTNTASKMLAGFGINIRGIVEANKGDVKKTVVDFAKALDTLDPVNRARAIEQLFGKFQFARMSTLFKNVIEQGSQASEVLKLASKSSLELSMLAQKELNKISESPLYKFQKAIADFQAQLAPVGEQFMKAITPIINFGTDVLKNFNSLGDGVKGFIVKFVAVAGIVGPVLLMSFGLIANAVANVIKGFALVKDIFNRTGKSSLSLGEQINYMTQEQINAAAIASSLDQVHSKLKQTFTSEAAAVDILTAAYERSIAAQRGFNVPITPRTPRGAVRRYAAGGFISGPGTGTSDSIPAMLSNGEAVIPARSVSQNKDLVQSLINNSLPRFATGGIVGTPSESLMQQVRGTSAVIAYGAHQPFTTAHQGIAQRGMSMAEESGIPFFQFTSNQGKAKRSVLGDDLKSRMISEAIGRNPEFAKNPFELMAILSKAGIKDVNILLGEDRMKSPVWEAAAKEFGITITKTGIPRPLGSPSGTMARAAAASGNVGMFESLLASGVSKSTRGEIFKSLFAAGNVKVRKFSNGGMISGPGSGTSDSILARVSNGEAIIPARSVARNPGMVRQLVSGNIPGFEDGVMPGIRQNTVRTYTDFTALLSNEANAALTKNAASKAGVIREFTSNPGAIQGPLIASLAEKLGGAKTQAQINKFLQQNPNVIKYAESLSNNIAGELSKLTTEKIGDKDLAPAVKRAIAKTPASKDIASAVQELSTVPTTFEDDSKLRQRSDGRLMAIGREKLTNLRGRYTSIYNRGKALSNRLYPQNTIIDPRAAHLTLSEDISIDELERKMSTQGLPLSSQATSAIDRKRRRVVSFLGREVPVGNTAQLQAEIKSAAKAEGKKLSAAAADGVVQGMAEEGQMRSPSRVTKKKGTELVQGAVQGMQSGIDDATQAGTQLGQAVATGARRVTSQGPWITPGMTQAEQIAVAKGKKVRVTSVGDVIPGQTTQLVDYSKVGSDTEVPVSGPVYGPQPATKFQKSRLGKISTKYNNFFTSAGVKVSNMDPGKFQGRMFGTSMGLGLASMVLPGEMGQMAGIASMFTGFAGIFKNLGPVVGKLIPLFGKLIPYVGLAITAYEVFDKAIVPMIRKNADAFNAISETLNVTKDKIDKINNFFGTEIELTGIRQSVVASESQTKDQATIAQQFQQSQDFKDTYQESAKKMQSLTEVEFKRAMQFMATDLFGQGMDKELVTAIIDAIAIEAKKSSVSIAPELFSLDNAETKAIMNKNIKSVLTEAASTAKKLQGQFDASGTGNLIEAGTGKYDNFWMAPYQSDPEDIAKFKSNVSEIGSYMSALSGQFENGTISGKEFEIQYAQLISMSNIAMGTSGPEAMRAAFISLNAEIGNTIAKLNDPQFDIVSRALLAGVVGTKESMRVFEWGTETQKEAQTKLYDEAYQLTLKQTAESKRLKSQISEINSQTQDNAKLEQKINDKYEKRIDQLEKIKTLNDQLAKSQQGQLTLAEALNKGDIAAAARAAIDIQNNDIQASLDNQKTGLEKAKKAELSPLKDAQEKNTDAVNALTKKIQDIINAPPPTVENIPDASKIQEPVGQVEGFLNLLGFDRKSIIDFGEKFGMKPLWQASGGHITGPGTGTSDSIPAMLSNGEYVIRANAVKTIGVDTLNKLNQADRIGFKNGGYNGYASGGLVSQFKKKNNPWDYPNVDPLDPKSVAAYKQRVANLFKPATRKDDPTWWDWTGGKQSMFDDTSNYPGYYQWTAPMAVGGSFGKVKTGPSYYTWSDSPFQLYNPLNSLSTNKELAKMHGEAFPNKMANQNPLDIIEAYSKILQGRRRLAENVYLPDLNKDTSIFTTKNPILYTIATYAKAFMNPKIYKNSTGGQDLDKARALMALGETSKMIPGWDGLDPKEFKNLTDSMHAEFGPAATKIMIGKLGFGERYKRLLNPPKGPSAKLNYAENYLGISGSIPKDSPIYQYAYNYMTNDYEGNKRGRLDWFKGSPNSFVMNPKLGTYNRLGFARGGMVGCPCGRPGCPGCSKGYSMGGMVGYKDGGKTKNWDLNDPSAPWNQGDYLGFNDPLTRKQYWAMAQPGSREIVDAGKTAGYFMPGIGAGLSFGDAATSFGKGDVGGGLLNTAFGFGGIWMPKAFGMIGKGFSAATNFIKTSLGIRGGSNALKAAAASTGADVSKVRKLTPTVAFNLSDAALQSMIKDNFYGNMRVPGIRSSTQDSLMNRIAVEKNMMGIPANAPASKTPAYGFLTTREDVPSYFNSITGGMGPRSASQQSIDDFNLLINPMSRYTGIYGDNTIKLKPSALGNSTISFGDSLSIWDKAIGLGQKIPGVDKLSSIFSTFPAMAGKLGSTQKMMKQDIPGIKGPARFPYIEAHLPGGFTVKDIESIMLNPTTRFGPQATEKIAADLAERRAALEALFESMGIKGIKITENGGIKIGDEALEQFKTSGGKMHEYSMANYPLPTKGPKSSIPKSIFSRTDMAIGEKLIPTFTIKRKNFAFQGKNNVLEKQDLKEFKELSQLGINIFDASPEGLLRAALKANPFSIKNRIMLSNLQKNKLGNKEITLLDNMIASISLDKTGKIPLSQSENTDGFAMMVAALAGNKNAKNIINFKTPKLYEIIENNLLSNKIKNADFMSNYKYSDTVATPSSVPVIHSTKYPVVRDKNGNVILNPLGHYNRDSARASVHTTLESPVQSHLYGSWDAAETKIVSSLSSMIKNNGLPYNLSSTDTWWMGKLKMSDSSVIRPFKDAKSYTEELIKRNLLEPGKHPGILTEDPVTKEVLHMIKETYTSVDRIQIQKMLKKIQSTNYANRNIGKPEELDISRKLLEAAYKGVSSGDETEILSELAMQLAKKQIGIKTYAEKLSAHGVGSNREGELKELAKSLNISFSAHDQSIPQILEGIGPFGTLKQFYNSNKLINTDTIEALRAAILNGNLLTSVVSNFPDFLANGGLVRGYATGGFVLPSPEPAPTQYALGGMVRAANGGMLLNGKFFGGFSRGGMVPSYLAQGGFAMGTDTVPAMLTPGEFVIKKSAVDRIGASALSNINRYADGGLVGGASAVSGDSVYNSNTYEINVNVSSNSNPNDIANAVMRQIKQIDNGRVRGLNR